MLVDGTNPVDQSFDPMYKILVLVAGYSNSHEREFVRGNGIERVYTSFS